MSGKGVDIDIHLRGRVPSADWAELSPVISDLTGKVGELGLLGSLDEAVISAVNERKRKPPIRRLEDYNLPENVRFEIIPMDEDQLDAAREIAGQKIKERRTSLGLSQTQVKDAMGDDGSHGWLSNLERNTLTGQRPHAPKVYLLARTLSFDPAEVLGWYGYELIIEGDPSEPVPE